MSVNSAELGIEVYHPPVEHDSAVVLGELTILVQNNQITIVTVQSKSTTQNTA